MSSSSSSGVGFCGLLTVLFVGLKLTNYINWSWWWVLSPLYLWIPIIATVLLAGLIIFLVFIGICCLLTKLDWK